MTDAIDTITEAIPCNIVYGRRQAAEGIARALTKAGFVILHKSEVEAIRDKALEEAAEIAQYIRIPADVQDHALRLGYFSASQAIAAAIRKLKSGGE